MDPTTKHSRIDGNHIEPSEEPKPESEWEDTNEFRTELAKKSDRASGVAKNRRRMLCFECNRGEGHALAGDHRWFYSYLIGLTFGLVYLVGPYQCQCCGAKRLMVHNYLNPRYWIRSFRHRTVSKPKKRSGKS